MVIGLLKNGFVSLCTYFTLRDSFCPKKNNKWVKKVPRKQQENGEIRCITSVNDLIKHCNVLRQWFTNLVLGGHIQPGFQSNQTDSLRKVESLVKVLSMWLDTKPGWIAAPEDRIWRPLDLRGYYRFGSLHLHRRVPHFPRQEVEGTSSGDRLDTKAETFFNADTLGEGMNIF